MNISKAIVALFVAATMIACSQDGAQSTAANEPTDLIEEQAVTEDSASVVEDFEVAPGLSARILQSGYGRAAEVGDYVEVHYTGWLFDAEADDNRGDKFDSSVDRGQKFNFTLGKGQVIKGWDQGVAGMLIGEKRELTLAPEMAYGERGAGSVIPPGATLVFEVELFGLEGSGDSG